MAKAYQPGEYEKRLYQLWEEADSFKPNLAATKSPFTIILPPPNANGNLHTGHAMYVVEDIMVRYRRMQATLPYGCQVRIMPVSKPKWCSSGS